MNDLRNFMTELEDRGELLRVKEDLSTKYEIPRALKRFNGDKVLLFEDVKEHDHRVVGGICGSRDRLIQALDLKAEELYQRLLEASKEPLKCRIGDGPVKEITREDMGLSEIPILTHFKGDPGPYITSGVVYARVGEYENISFHRLLVLDNRRMTMRIVPRHLYRLTQLAEDKGLSSVDVSISIGLHPAISVAVSLPAPFGVSEFDVANNLLEGGLQLTACEHVDALAPSNAELVIEGRLRLDEKDIEGPFVDLSGTYDVQRAQPVVEVEGVMHREDFIYQALLPSGSEHRLLMGMPREVRIWDYVGSVVPTVKGVNMTTGGMGWLHCVVSFEKFREGDPKNVLMAVFAAHPSLKHAVVVDGDIDPHDMEEVEWAIATRFKGDEDLLLVPNVRVSSLDPSADQEKELGCKVGIDATRPLFKDPEGFHRAEIPTSPELENILDRYRE
ncbi:MAG: UbiD family decarboxylase [Candidatus Bathyarchaeia archaeon]